MKRYFATLTILISLLTGCANKPVSINITEPETVAAPDSLLPPGCIPKNFTTPLGTTVAYVTVGSKVKISWGNTMYKRATDSLYHCFTDENKNVWDFIPKYETETKNHLLFTNILWTSSGGNPAPLEYYTIVLPKNTKDAVYQKDFFIAAEGDYLIYCDGLNDTIHVLNVETDREQVFTLTPKQYVSRSPTMAIQKTTISKNKFEVQYETIENSDSITIVKNVFEIKI